MTRAPILVLALVSSLAASAALAQAYQWKDSSGRTVISDTPPPASVRGSKSIGTSPPPSIGSGSEAKPADAPKTTAEKDLEFRKRQQEAREKSEKEAKEASAAQQKRENCDRARSQLGALESGRRMVVPDGKGGETFLEDEARNAEMERARKIIADSCN